MAALETGALAPQIDLPAMDGGRFSLQEALRRGPVLAAFFKISCPVCQYAFPYFERIYKAYGNPKLSIIGVSQNDRQETAEFIRRYGITFPVLLEDTKNFGVSNAYGLTNVPTAFWINPAGEIEIASVGWVRSEIEEIARKAASAGGQEPKAIFLPAEQIPDFRAG
jgi:peroxiredoxin